MNALNCLCQHGSHGELLNPTAIVRCAAQRNGIGHDDFFDLGGFNALHRGTGENGVGCAGAHARGALLKQSFGAFDQSPGRVDQIVHDQAVLAFDLADDVHHFRHIYFRPPLIDNRQRRIQSFREGTRALHAARIGRRISSK